jgi:hypothetical protein
VDLIRKITGLTLNTITTAVHFRLLSELRVETFCTASADDSVICGRILFEGIGMPSGLVKPHVFLLIVFATISAAFGQDITKGSIAGVVRDATGASVPNVTVHLKSTSGDRTTTTDGSGTYTFLNLIPSRGYAISVAQPGFETTSLNNIAVEVNQRTTADLTLQVGQSTVRVDVEGSAAQAIDLASTATGAVLDSSL